MLTNNNDNNNNNNNIIKRTKELRSTGRNYAFTIIWTALPLGSLLQLFHVTCTLPFRDLMYATGLYSQEDERKIEKKAFLLDPLRIYRGIHLIFAKRTQ